MMRSMNQACIATWLGKARNHAGIGSTDTARAPRHHARDEHAALPEDEARVVARTVHPARLVGHDDAGIAPLDPVELRDVVDMHQEPEEVARIGSREAGLLDVERAAAGRSQPNRAEKPRDVPCGRVLPIAVRRLLVDAQRDPRGERPQLVPAVHLRAAHPDRAHHAIDHGRAAARRAAEPHLERVRRRVVRSRQHRPHERVDLRAGVRQPFVTGEYRGGDGELHRGRAGERRTSVPGRSGTASQACDVDARGAGEPADARSESTAELRIRAGCDDPRLRSGREAVDVVHVRRGPPSVARERRHPDRRVAHRQRHLHREAPAEKRLRRETSSVC